MMNLRRTGAKDAVTLVVTHRVTDRIGVKAILCRIIKQLRERAVMEKRTNDVAELAC